MKYVAAILGLIIAVPMIILIIMAFGSAGRKLLGDDPDKIEKPAHWLKTIVIGIIGFMLFGYIASRSGCSRHTNYEMENSRDPGY